jgi:hypothetical protein
MKKFMKLLKEKKKIVIPAAVALTVFVGDLMDTKLDGSNIETFLYALLNLLG